MLKTLTYKNFFLMIGYVFLGLLQSFYHNQHCLTFKKYFFVELRFNH